MAKSIGDSVVWITGGGSGIGRALAIEFGRRGCQVAVSGRRVERLEAVVTEIVSAGGSAIAVECDVTRDESVVGAVERVKTEFGRLDVAVANAGFGVGGGFEEITSEQWRAQLNTNVVGVAATLRYALPSLKEVAGRAAVVSSVMGKFCLAGSAPYCASKHALMALCNCLRQELHGTEVTLTNLLPGLVDSEIFQIDNDGVRHENWGDRRPRRFKWPADRAAKVMADAIESRRSEFTFTGHGRLLGFLGQHAPRPLYWAMTRGGAKNVK